MEFIIYQDVNGEWRWSLVAKNGKILAVSGDGYKQKGKCMQAVDILYDAVRSNAFQNILMRQAGESESKEESHS